MIDEVPKLGRLERVDLRDVWANEPYIFTPWLAQPENLGLLATELGLPGLDLVQIEQQVSEFSVDIVARITGSEDRVIIENQLEKSDHRHLGQLISYAGGVGPAAVVWIAPEFTDGHRAAIEWLNRMTAEDVGFFAVQVGAVRIADSPYAPEFKAVVRPNEWARVVRSEARSEGVSSDNASNIAYWAAYAEAAGADGVRRPEGKPVKGANYYTYLHRGEPQIAVSAYLLRSKRRMGAYLWIWSSDAGRAGEINARLQADKSSIEEAYGAPLSWNKMSDTSYWITDALPEIDPDDEADWPRQHAWLAEKMRKLRDIFAPRVQAVLDATARLDAEAAE